MANGRFTSRDIPLQGIIPRLLRGESVTEMLSTLFTEPQAADFLAPLSMVRLPVKSARRLGATADDVDEMMREFEEQIRKTIDPGASGSTQRTRFIEEQIQKDVDELERVFRQTRPRERALAEQAKQGDEAFFKTLDERFKLLEEEKRAMDLASPKAVERFKEMVEFGELDLEAMPEIRPPIEPSRVLLDTLRDTPPVPAQRTIKEAREFAREEIDDLDDRLLESLSVLPLLGL